MATTPLLPSSFSWPVLSFVENATNISPEFKFRLDCTLESWFSPPFYVSLPIKPRTPNLPSAASFLNLFSQVRPALALWKWRVPDFNLFTPPVAVAVGELSYSLFLFFFFPLENIRDEIFPT